MRRLRSKKTKAFLLPVPGGRSDFENSGTAVPKTMRSLAQVKTSSETRPPDVGSSDTKRLRLYFTERTMLTEIWAAGKDFPPAFTSGNTRRYGRFGRSEIPLIFFKFSS